MQALLTTLCLTAALGLAGQLGLTPNDAMTTSASAQCSEMTNNAAVQRYEDAVTMQRSFVRSGLSLPAGSGESLMSLRSAARSSMQRQANNRCITKA